MQLRSEAMNRVPTPMASFSTSGKPSNRELSTVAVAPAKTSKTVGESAEPNAVTHVQFAHESCQLCVLATGAVNVETRVGNQWSSQRETREWR
jgi:hypothetical protein